MDIADPADWSVDQVVQELCSSAPPKWLVNAGLRPIANPAVLAQAFRDNDIDGDNLLALEDDHLKTDLHITSFGQRRGLRSIISYLRITSPKHQTQQRHSDVNVWATPHASHTSIASRIQSPLLTGFDASKDLGSTHHDEQEQAAGGGVNARMLNASSSHGAARGPLISEEGQAIIYDKDDMKSPYDPLLTSNTFSMHTNAEPAGLGGQYAQHASNTSANLPQIAPHHSPPQSLPFLNDLDLAIDQELHSSFTSAPAHSSLHQAIPDTTMPPRGRKKTKKPAVRMPATQSAKDRSTTPWPPGSVHQQLSPEPSEGQPSRNQGSVHDATLRINKDLEARQDTNRLPAPMVFSNRGRRLRRADMLPQPITVLPTSVQPDSASYVGKLFAEHDARNPEARLRERLTVQPLSPTDVTFPPLSEEERKLVARYPEGRVLGLVPISKKSRDESSSAQPMVTGGLTPAKVDSIIEDYTQTFRDYWKANNFVITQAEAHKIWIDTAGNNDEREELLERTKNWYDHLLKRFSTMRGQIHAGNWNMAGLRQQCESFEVSISQLEEYNLYITVLESNEEPPCPSPTQVVQSRKPRPRANRDDDEITLHSDSAGSEDDSDGEDVTESEDFWLSDDEADHVEGVSAVRGSSNPNEHGADLMLVDDDQSMFVSQDEHDISDGQDFNQPSRKRSRFSRDEADYERALFSSEDAFQVNGYLPEPKRMMLNRNDDPNNIIDLTQGESPANFAAFGDANFFSQTSPDSQTNMFRSDAELQSTMTNQLLPYLLDVQRISSMDWSDLIPENADDAVDNMLVFAKMIYDLEKTAAVKTLNYLVSLRDNRDLEELLSDGLEAEMEDSPVIAGVLSTNQKYASTVVECFLCYAIGFCQNLGHDLTHADIHAASDQITTRSPSFYNVLTQFLQSYKDDVAVSSTKDSASKRKPRKPRVLQSKRLIDEQVADQQRVELQEAKRDRLLQQGPPIDLQANRILIPVNFDPPRVFLEQNLADVVKPHQVLGIQFMWREIVENKKHLGCLLAHSMGLGKTLQVIALLATVARCGQSDDPALRQLIPPHLRRPRIMILCPWALMENWSEEIQRWLPSDNPLAPISKLDNRVRSPEKAIEKWYKERGVLIISYERFRKFVQVSDKDAEKFSEKVLDKRRSHLVDGPDIVVADEAHRLKNAASQIHKATIQIKTTSKIAMTGSPLNNHLEEYHTMINWISANYLGNLPQFKARYIEPIVKGLELESSELDRKLSLKKLHMLKTVIGPKVHRLDLTVIANELPPKVEFILVLTLTELQKEAYQMLIDISRALSQGNAGKKEGPSPWTWISFLTLLVNHPSCLLQKLRQEGNGQAAKAAKAAKAPAAAQAETPEAEVDDDDSEADVSQQLPAEEAVVAPSSELSKALKKKVIEFFEQRATIHGEDDVTLSNKSVLIQKIIIEAARNGEKTLIFTKSIATLDYYERMVKKMGMDYKRIDGQKNVTTGSRQRIVNEFNNGEKFKVFLISTKAGGLGLNMQSASRVIINDFDFNPAWEEQAIGRAYRMGQTKPVFVYRFVIGGTFEEVVHKKSIFKTQLFTRVVDEQNVIAQANRAPGDYLFDPKDVPQDDFTDCIGKDTQVLDRILQEVDCVRNIITTDAFFQERDEHLNEEEKKAADEEARLERLGDDNPTKYRQEMAEKSHSRTDIAQPDVHSPAAEIHRDHSAPRQSMSSVAPPSGSLPYMLTSSSEFANRPLLPERFEALQVHQPTAGSTRADRHNHTDVSTIDPLLRNVLSQPASGNNMMLDNPIPAHFRDMSRFPGLNFNFSSGNGQYGFKN